VPSPVLVAAFAFTAVGYIVLFMALADLFSSMMRYVFSSTGEGSVRVPSGSTSASLEDLIFQTVGLLILGPIAIFIVRAIYYAQQRVRGVRITPTQFPEAYQMLAEAAEAAGLRRVPDAYVILGNGVMNAFAAGHGVSRGGGRAWGACRGAMSQPVPLPIRMAGVGHEFGANGVRVRALDGIDLEVAPGELLAVMGPSGSGKSTLLSIAGGLERPTHGSVYVNGIDLAGLDSVHRAEVRRRSIGYVFQDYNLIPSLSALENVEMPLQLDGVSPSKVREAAMAALTEVGVAELADRFPERLSGGQRQRVAIARGLVGNRSVILADEPTGALDSHTGEQIMLVLRNHIDAGAAGILVTHEARMAAWADRTVFLRDGRIVDRSRGDSLRDLLADAAPRI